MSFTTTFRHTWVEIVVLVANQLANGPYAIITIAECSIVCLHLVVNVGRRYPESLLILIVE